MVVAGIGFLTSKQLEQLDLPSSGLGVSLTTFGESSIVCRCVLGADTDGTMTTVTGTKRSYAKKSDCD